MVYLSLSKVADTLFYIQGHDISVDTWALPVGSVINRLNKSNKTQLNKAMM